MSGRTRILFLFVSLLSCLAAGWGQSVRGNRIPTMSTGTLRISELPPYTPGASSAEGQEESPSHGSVPDFPMPASQAKKNQPQAAATAIPVDSAIATPAAAPASSFNSLSSPSPALSFQAQPMIGGYPPDTTGAVGPNHAMSASNDQVVIEDRLGHQLSNIGLNAFWQKSFSNVSPAWDPNVRYDPYANRWIFVCMANYSYSTSAMLIAVSATSDPTGTWYLRRINSDSTSTTFDHPRVGFNQNWIVVTGNQVQNSAGNPWIYSTVYAFDKADFYANGSKLPVEFSNITTDFTITPALTYDPTLSTMYMMANYNGANGALSLSTLTGAVDAPVLSLNVAFPTTTNTWASTVPQNFAPQLGSTTNIGVFDARMNTVVYRNGSLWATHTVFVPAAAPKISAVDWWQVGTDGTVLQFGRLQDPASVYFYAYPSLAVNANGDMLVGYARMASTQYASAAYAFRAAADPAGTLRSEFVMEAGQATYVKLDGNGINRWGDYSATQVDPVNDKDFWTVQEYAGPNLGYPTWGEWWANIIAPAASGPPALQSVSVNPATVTGGSPSTGTVTLTGIAPTGGVVVTVSSNSTAAQVPAGGTVTIPAGAASATFSITTSAVSAVTPVTISAIYSGVTQTASLTVNPVGTTALSVVQAQQAFNTGSGLTSITASIASTAGHLLVAYVREGSSSTDNFTVTDNLAQTWTLAGYSSINSTNRSAIYYRPNSAAVTSVTANFTTSGGVTRPGIVVYEIAGAAASAPLDAGPASNTFSSSQTSITSAPLTTSNANDILILAVDLASSQSGTNNSFVPGAGFSFPATGAATTPRQAVSYEIVSSKQTSLTSSMSWAASTGSGGSQFIAFKAAPTGPAALQSVSVNPAAVTGGSPSTGTVTLTNVAPTGGAVVTVSSNSTAAQVPAGGTVTVPAGATSATFSVTTSAVSAATPVTISAVYSGVTQTASLTVNPAGTTALSVVQAQQAFNTGSGLASITASIASTAGHLLVAYVREGSSATDNFTVTDNLGQAWTLAGYNSINSTNRSAIYYRPNSAALSSVTANFTTTGGVTRPGIVVYEIAGAAASAPLDAGPASNTFSSAQTSITSAPLTTSNANDILILAVDLASSQSGTNNSFVPGAGFSFPATGAATTPRQAVSYKIVASTQTSLTTSMSWAASASGGSLFIAFKAGP